MAGMLLFVATLWGYGRASVTGWDGMRFCYLQTGWDMARWMRLNGTGQDRTGHGGCARTVVASAGRQALALPVSFLPFFTLLFGPCLD